MVEITLPLCVMRSTQLSCRTNTVADDPCLVVAKACKLRRNRRQKRLLEIRLILSQTVD